MQGRLAQSGCENSEEESAQHMHLSSVHCIYALRAVGECGFIYRLQLTGHMTANLLCFAGQKRVKYTIPGKVGNGSFPGEEP